MYTYVKERKWLIISGQSAFYTFCHLVMSDVVQYASL